MSSKYATSNGEQFQRADSLIELIDGHWISLPRRGKCSAIQSSVWRNLVDKSMRWKQYSNVSAMIGYAF